MPGPYWVYRDIWFHGSALARATRRSLYKDAILYDFGAVWFIYIAGFGTVIDPLPCILSVVLFSVLSACCGLEDGTLHGYWDAFPCTLCMVLFGLFDLYTSNTTFINEQSTVLIKTHFPLSCLYFYLVCIALVWAARREQVIFLCYFPLPCITLNKAQNFTETRRFQQHKS